MTTSSQISSRLGCGEASASNGSLGISFFVGLLRLVSSLEQTTTKSQKLLKRPVRLCSWSLGKVAPAGHLPENQAAGVHVDPGHSLLDKSVLVDLGDQAV